MKKTRDTGVYRLEDGRWRVRVTSRTSTGRKLFRVATLPATTRRSEVLRRRVELLGELEARIEDEQSEADLLEPRSAQVTTLAAYAERWLNERSRKLKPSSINSYIITLSRVTLPYFGAHCVADIDRAMVKRFARHLERGDENKCYSPHTLRNHWGLTRMLLRDAAADFELPDPTRRVSVHLSQTSRKRERRTLTRNQLQQLLMNARAGEGVYSLAAHVLGLTGVRAGELVALHWSDVDLDAQMLHVQRQAWRGIVGTTKTGYARSIAIVPQLAREFARHQGAHWTSGTWIFPEVQDRQELLVKRIRRALAKISEDLIAAGVLPEGLIVGPLVLRRTVNTLLVESGAPGIVIRSQMGHSSEEMTVRYAGVNDGAKQSALAALDLSVVSPSGITHDPEVDS